MIFSPVLAIVSAMLGWALLLLSIFLILLILVQRGRGGGLTGALGGPGGQSAFGTKAGDLFTRITSFVALGWIALCAFTMWLIGSHAPTAVVDPTPTVSASPADQPATDMIDWGEMDRGTGGLGDPLELTPAAPADPAVPETGQPAAPPAGEPATTDPDSPNQLTPATPQAENP